MAHNPRQETILNLIHNYRQVSVAELTERLGVSQVTIRKDLTRLEEMGLIIRSHGGASLAQTVGPLPSVNSRKEVFFEEKDRITTRALDLIREEDSVCIDAGATNLLLAKKVVNLPIRLVSNSLEILNILASSRDVTLTAIGGNFRAGASSFIGPLAEDTVNQLQFDIAFIGATGITAEGDFLTQNAIEGRLKRAMLTAARRRVILADSSKFEARAFSKFARPDLVDILITDKGFPRAEEFRDLGIEVITV